MGALFLPLLYEIVIFWHSVDGFECDNKDERWSNKRPQPRWANLRRQIGLQCRLSIQQGPICRESHFAYNVLWVIQPVQLWPWKVVWRDRKYYKRIKLNMQEPCSKNFVIWKNLITFRENHARQWCQLLCKTANSRTQRLFYQLTNSQPPRTSLRNGHSNSADPRCDSVAIAAHSASDDSYNCRQAVAYLFGIVPNMHCSCNVYEHREYFHHCSGNCVAQRSRLVSMGHFQYFL